MVFTFSAYGFAIEPIPALYIYMQAKSDFRTRPEEKSLADYAEILAAVNSLTEEELFKLRRFAQWRILGMGNLAGGREYTDLLHQAIVNTLDMRRIWVPAEVTFFNHLLGAMRSIASAWSAKAINEARMRVVDESIPDADGEPTINPFLSAPAYEPSPESQVSARQLIDAITNAVRADEKAYKALMTMFDGSTDSEGPVAAGLTRKQYDAAKKRIRRRMKKIMEPMQTRPASDVPQ
jgi:hypothetical protein